MDRNTSIYQSWTQAKYLRMSYDAEGAINVMLNGLNMDRPKSFQQADGLVSSLQHRFLDYGHNPFSIDHL